MTTPESPTDRHTVNVNSATKENLLSLCAQTGCTQDQAVAAGLAALQYRTLAGNGLIRLDLVRATEILEASVVFLAETNLQMADACSALLLNRLDDLDALVQQVGAAKGGQND